MKKHIYIISLLLCIVCCAVALVGCAAPGAPEYDVSAPSYVEIDGTEISSVIETELDMFLDANPDRTTFNEGERKAAEYLSDRLVAFGYDNVVLQSFTVSENNVSGLESQNVIVKLPAKISFDSPKNIILGAYYDNRYSQSYKNAETIKAESALAGGSGVATLLAIAKYLQTVDALDFDVTIVFFGASYYYTDGAREYLRNGMTADERKNTVLMVEMQRLGVDHVYAYSDARQTKRETFFDGIASANGLDIYKPTQKSPVMTGVSVADGVPYFQWAHSGLVSVFAGADIPTLNLVGANWETINLGDTESAKYPDIAYTENDDRTVFKKYYPDYAKKAATAATLVVRSVEDPEFLQTMTYDREHYPNTDVLTTFWIWDLVVIGMLAIVMLVIFLVYRRLDKKYKLAPTQPPRMKMAVFGMDYEDKSSADIFVDIRNDNEEIFPGVPNNDPALAKNLIDDIFPPLFDEPFVTKTNAPESNEGDKDVAQHTDNVAAPHAEDNEVASRSGNDVEQNAEESVSENNTDEPERENPTETKPERAEFNETEINGSETAQVEESNIDTGREEITESSTDVQNVSKKQPKTKSEPVIEIVKPAPKKRATVSAKKSVGAKKSVSSGSRKSDTKDENTNKPDAD